MLFDNFSLSALIGSNTRLRYLLFRICSLTELPRALLLSTWLGSTPLSESLEKVFFVCIWECVGLGWECGCCAGVRCRLLTVRVGRYC